MIRLLRRVLRLGLLAGVGVGVLKVVRGRKGPDPWADSWVSTGPPGGTRPSPAPAAVAPKPVQVEKAAAGTSKAAKAESAKSAPSRQAKPTRTGPARKSPTGKAEDPPGERLWVPANDGVCPQSHPVKAKLSSKIFHTPASRNYSRTKADRCYPDETSAQADGLRPPQH
ncbi:MAG TPA: hypothetical protein VJS45_19080 [Acidimicrobiia bacterium]|nr:hypothetical protein [Acidimicrobiia bacterium]